MEEKTAVEWLFSRIVEEWEVDCEERDIAILEQAKEIEKQQKDIDYQNGYLDCYAKLMSERLTRDI